MNQKPSALTAYQFRLLAILALINFVNFADRQVLPPLVPLLRQYLGLTDAQLGALQTGLLVILAVGSVPFGFLADRVSRKYLIAGGILFWSCASFASGLAGAFATLLVARALVGIG